MNVTAVTDELAEKFDAVAGMRVYPFPPDALAAPAIVVGYPDVIEFDQSFIRGVDQMTVPVHLVIDRNWDRATAEQFGDYTSGSGPSSVKQLIETKPHTAFDTARVRSVSFGAMTVAGLEYWVATFLVDITGSGA